VSGLFQGHHQSHSKPRRSSAAKAIGVFGMESQKGYGGGWHASSIANVANVSMLLTEAARPAGTQGNVPNYRLSSPSC